MFDSWQHETIKVTRIAEPIIHPALDIVDVNYEILIENKSNSTVERITEKHEVRYWFLPELMLMLKQAEFKVLDVYEWLKCKKPTCDSWFACIVAEAL